MKMPPDLSEAARPLAVGPPASSAAPSSPPAMCGPRCLTSSSCSISGSEHYNSPGHVIESSERSESKAVESEHDYHHSGTVGNMVSIVRTPRNTVIGGERIPTVTATPSLNFYHLTPALRSAFTSVGATDRAYTFKEILQMLKSYLYGKRELFDRDDYLYVNCGGDPLGVALKVDRFHYNDVKNLMATAITRVHPGSSQTLTSGHNLMHTFQPENVLPLNHRTPARPPNFRDDKENQSIIVDNNSTNDRTESQPLKSSCTNFGTLDNSRQVDNLLLHKGETSHSIVPGPSSHVSLASGGVRERRWSASIASYKVVFPDIPDSNSDNESIFSCQGYETALCRNTEFEESEDEDYRGTDVFEEYEIASDVSNDVQYSDDDDSVIEDVEVAVLAIHALCQDESEEDFWADESDTDDILTDEEDSELVSERWSCLTCNQTNKAFVRYCSKCWQLRKNWLPDRPKRRRRKPRPKKKHKRQRSKSLQSEDPSVDLVIKSQDSLVESAISNPSSSNSNQSESSLTRTSSADSQYGGSLVKTSSTASTISFGASPPRNYGIDHFSSQDSGISLSQDLLSEFSVDVGMEESQETLERVSSGQKTSTNTQPPSTGEATSSKALQSNVLKEEDPTQSNVLKEEVATQSNVLKGEVATQSKVLKEEVATSSVSKKRKSSPSEEHSAAKRCKVSEPKTSSNEDSGEDEDVELKARIKGFKQFLSSDSGKEWLKTSDGRNFVKEALAEVGESSTTSEPLGEEEQESVSNKCLMCCIRPKNAAIVHGRLTHQATCYQCARRLLDTGARCPVCRRKIHMVTKHIVA